MGGLSSGWNKKGGAVFIDRTPLKAICLLAADGHVLDLLFK